MRKADGHRHRAPFHNNAADNRIHITASASAQHWFDESDHRGRTFAPGFLRPSHVLEGNQIGQPWPTYSLPMRSTRDTRLCQTAYDIAEMNLCIERHTPYRGLFHSTDVANGTPAPVVPAGAVGAGAVGAGAAGAGAIGVGDIGGPKTAAGAKAKRLPGKAKIKKWTTGPNPPYTNPGPTIQINGIVQWAVDEILDSTVLGPNTDPAVPENAHGVHYKVKWSGWPPDNNWYPARAFQNCPAKLQEYHNRNLDHPEPANLNLWHQRYIRGTIDSGANPGNPLCSGRVL